MYLTMCILTSKEPNINLILLITKTVSAFVPLKHIEKQSSFAIEVCFSSLKLKFPLISGLKEKSKQVPRTAIYSKYLMCPFQRKTKASSMNILLHHSH